MLIADIPNRVQVKCTPFNGVYDKRRMKDRTLFCWFNNEDEDNFPHISIHQTLMEPDLKRFHVTFPVLHQGGWDAEAEKRSFSLYFQINGGKLELYDQNSDTIRRSKNDSNPMSYDEMTELGKIFALRFVQNAMVQSALV